MLDKSKKIAKAEQGRVVKVLRKTVLPLILGFILALQPVAYAAAAGEDSGKVTTGVADGFTSTIQVVLPTIIGDDAMATNTDGVAIIINPGPVTLTISSNQNSFTLPVSLPDNQDIESFTDPDTGITIDGDEITIPLRNQAGQDVLFIKATKIGVESEGTESTFALKNVVLASAELTPDLSAADEAVGTICVSFEVDLKALPEGVIIETEVNKDPDPHTRSSFDEAVSAEDRGIRDIGYVLGVKKTNLENGTHLGSARITMKVGRAWAEDNGLDNIVIVRSGEGGEQYLITEYIGFDGDKAIFKAESPVGLSYFGLVALASTQAGNPWYIVGGVGGAVLVSGVLIFLILRRRRIRDSMLTSSWPTGLRPEDWKDPDLK